MIAEKVTGLKRKRGTAQEQASKSIDEGGEPASEEEGTETRKRLNAGQAAGNSNKTMEIDEDVEETLRKIYDEF